MARLTVDGKPFQQPVTILMDPHSPGSEADIDASVKLQLRLREDVDTVSAMVNRIEWFFERVMTKDVPAFERVLAEQKIAAMPANQDQTGQVTGGADDDDNPPDQVGWEYLYSLLAAGLAALV